MSVDTETGPRSEVRAEVAGWLAEHWSPSLGTAEWRALVVDARWAFPTWPEEWFGRGLSQELGEVVTEEFQRIGAPVVGAGIDVENFFLAVLGNTLISHGSDALKRKLLGPLLDGELGRGCLLYSEPGAGSDLAALQTRADRDGDHFVVNGQKIWSSGSLAAEYGLLIARTNWDVPKHKGLSFFIIPMRQDGIEVRGIKMMAGSSEFGEVFLTDALVPAENLVGELDDGWAVLQTALAHERSALGAAGPQRSSASAGRWSLPVLDGASDLVDAARRAGREDDAAVRQLIAQLHTWRLANQWSNERAAAQQRSGRPSSLAMIGKLAMSRIKHTSGTVQRLLDGPEALLFDYNGAADGPVNRTNHEMMSAFVVSIGGGTDQIQRNIIGERVLGLPKPFEEDRTIPFRDTRKDTTARRFS